MNTKMTVFNQSEESISRGTRADKILIFLGIPIIVGAILGLLVLFVPFEYVIFAFGGLIFTYLILFHIDIAIIITLLIQNQLGQFNYLGGDTPYHPNGILGLLLIGGGILYFITHKIDYSRVKASGGFLAYIIIGAFSLIDAGDYLMDGVTILLRIMAAFSIYVILSHKIESITQVKWVFGAIIAAQIYPTISGLFSSSGLTGFFFTDETARLGDSGVGVYLSIISILCIIFFFSTQKLSTQIGWGILTVLFLAGLFFSFGRSGWIGFIFGLALMAVIRFKKLVFILPFILILIIVLVPAIGQRFQDIEITDLGGEGNDTFSGRVKYWLGGLDVFVRNPVLGVGIGIGRYFVGSYLGEYAMMIHNDYISTLVETGLIGFIIFLFWHYRWFEDLAEAYKNTSKHFDRTAIFGALIVLSSIMVMRITDNILLDTYDMYPLCAMIAAVLAIPRIREKEKSTNEQYLSFETPEKGLT
jgi:hypothetical protein